MADLNTTDSSDLTPYEAEQLQAERAALAVLLDEHPSQLAIPELCRMLYAGPSDFESNDVVERAVRDLVGCGLLNCEGPFVVPTKAARCAGIGPLISRHRRSNPHVHPHYECKYPICRDIAVGLPRAVMMSEEAKFALGF